MSEFPRRHEHNCKICNSPIYNEINQYLEETINKGKKINLKEMLGLFKQKFYESGHEKLNHQNIYNHSAHWLGIDIKSKHTRNKQIEMPNNEVTECVKKVVTEELSKEIRTTAELCITDIKSIVQKLNDYIKINDLRIEQLHQQILNNKISSREEESLSKLEERTMKAMELIYKLQQREVLFDEDIIKDLPEIYEKQVELEKQKEQKDGDSLKDLKPLKTIIIPNIKEENTAII